MVQEMVNKGKMEDITRREFMNTILKISAGAGLAGLINGCAEAWDDPVSKAFNNVLPKFLQPGGHRDAMERERKENSIQVNTPQGYTVTLHPGLNVYYYGKIVHIQELVPPYVGLVAGKHQPGRFAKHPTMVKITELDMFRQ